MKFKSLGFGATIPSVFDAYINGTSHGRQVPRHPTMDEADDNADRERQGGAYFTGRSHFLSRRRKPARKP